MNIKKSESYNDNIRPWGEYKVLEHYKNSKIKRIIVLPKSKLSLQMHKYRSEHWVIVEGTANIVRGNEEFILKENESTYIPKSTVHRIENPLDKQLELIEVQIGNYLEEDDIIRFEDDYGRVVANNKT
jgi:mannose-1-phosphate guanylyltransferase/mannose-6-phosphate isomerase